MNIFRSKSVLCVFGVLAYAFLASAAVASLDDDLKRLTPVPADQPIPIVDFFRPALLREPKLNLAGTHVGAIVTLADDRHQLMIFELGSDKAPETVGGAGDKDIYDFWWLTDRRVLFGLSTKKLWGVGLLAADVGKINEAYPILQYYASNLIAVREGDRAKPLVWNRNNIDTGRDQGAAIVNTDVHAGTMVDLTVAGITGSMVTTARDNNEQHIVDRFPMPDGGVTAGYLANKEGELEFAFTMDKGKEQLQRFVSGKWVVCPVNLDEIYVIGAGEEPGQVVVLGSRQPGKPRAVQFMDATTGKLGEVLLQDEAYDFFGSAIYHGTLFRDPKTHLILGASFQGLAPKMVWLSEDYRKIQKLLDGRFPGQVVRILSVDQAQDRLLFATTSDRQPPIYNWLDLGKVSMGLIKNSMPWIDPERMRPMNAIKFKTRDGKQLDAYLTLPAGASKKHPVPLVVLPHGGPWARDSWGFDGEVQFLASRGYAVLQPNYRGSNGYEWLFPEEDKWDFRKMHDDVTDAAKAVLASGYIDKGRVAIMGSSFGGYLAISGVVNEPGLYRCAVTIAGVFDWENHLRDKKYDQFDTPEFGVLKRRLGDPKQHAERYEAISPGRHVDRIHVPVFVAAGRMDPRVDIEQARSLISALKKYDVPHETLIEEDEGHGYAHLDKNVELYTKIEAFLDKYVKNASPTEAAQP